MDSIFDLSLGLDAEPLRRIMISPDLITCGTLTVKKPEIEKVIYNKPATIIKWSDGTKTVVKCDKEDVYDPVKGLLIAILKKNYGNKGSFYKDLVVPWLPKEEEKHD